MKSHIHGTLMREIDLLHAEIQNKYLNLQSYNNKLKNLYNRVLDDIEGMSPTMPYPFLSVLSNPNIDSYYHKRKDALGRGLDLIKMLDTYDSQTELLDQIKSNKEFTQSLSHDIKKFNMSLLINNTDPSKWQFLPDLINQEEIFKDLDQRALPFCSVTAEFGNNAKYILYMGADSDSVKKISRYFNLSPMALDCPDPNSITILHISKYNILH